MTSGRITVTLPDAESYSLEVEAEEVLEVGRKPGVAGRRKLVLALVEVSGQHAEIHCKSSGWTVVDSGSTNGTTLNERRLQPGHHYPLRTGDVIHICQYPPQVDLQVFPPPGTPVPEAEDPDERYYRLRTEFLKQLSAKKSTADETGTSNRADGE